jgi:hypothetical protein
MRVGFFSKILSHIYKEEKKDNDNMKKWTEVKEITEKKPCLYFILFVDNFLSKENVWFSYCVDDGGIKLFAIVDVGVIVAAHDNFLGISVSGVGISWPVIVSGTSDVVASLLLFVLFVGSGLLAANLPCAFATL